MAARDYTTAPVADQLGIPSIIAGLCNDLAQLRKGEISVNDAMARSKLAKQIFNGVRIYMNGTKLLADNARTITASRDSGRLPEGEDSRSEAECAASQSGGATSAASPTPKPPSHPSNREAT